MLTAGPSAGMPMAGYSNVPPGAYPGAPGMYGGGAVYPGQSPQPQGGYM